MSTTSVYLLDSSSLVQANRTYYASDLVPQFWDSLVSQADAGNLRIIDWIWDEVKDGREGDHLKKWVAANFKSRLAQTRNDQPCEDCYREVVEWKNDG